MHLWRTIWFYWQSTYWAAALVSDHSTSQKTSRKRLWILMHTHTHTGLLSWNFKHVPDCVPFFCCCLYCHKFNIWNKKGFHSLNLNLYQSKVTVCLDVFSAKFVTTRRSLYGIHNLHGFFFKSSVVNPHTYIYPYYKRTSKPRSQSIDVEQVFTENAQWYWKKKFKYFYLFGKSPI